MSAFAAATGVGSWPGTSPRPAAEVIVGELHALPHLVELPARGVGADMIGRAGALLVDIAIDTMPRGYRLAARPGAVTRRAISFFEEDLDALEEAWERAGLRGSGRVVKVQAPGPVTLAAQVELPGGHRAITDGGAVRDLAMSLAEGVAIRCAEVARRLQTTVAVQFDEPSLGDALTGRLTGVTALSPVHPVEETTAVELLDECVAAVAAEVAVHTCSSDVPWKVLCRSGIHAVSVDASRLGDDLDGLAEFVDTGRTAVLGVIPTIAPRRPVSAKETVQAVVALTDRLGVARAGLVRSVGVSPSCGLAGATLAWARTAIGLAQQVADALVDDPESL